MEYLLDTNVLLFSFVDRRRLSRKLLRILEDNYNDIYYTPVNIWEVALKYSRGKLQLDGRTPDEFLDYLEGEGIYDFQELFTGSIATSYQLPQRHGDPFDRMIVWEALQYDRVLLTTDEALREYEQDGLRIVT